jgi:hypothetical protein
MSRREAGRVVISIKHVVSACPYVHVCVWMDGKACACVTISVCEEVHTRKKKYLTFRNELSSPSIESVVCGLRVSITQRYVHVMTKTNLENDHNYNVIVAHDVSICSRWPCVCVCVCACVCMCVHLHFVDGILACLARSRRG